MVLDGLLTQDFGPFTLSRRRRRAVDAKMKCIFCKAIDRVKAILVKVSDWVSKHAEVTSMCCKKDVPCDCPCDHCEKKCCTKKCCDDCKCC